MVELAWQGKRDEGANLFFKKKKKPPNCKKKKNFPQGYIQETLSHTDNKHSSQPKAIDADSIFVN
jgi:hypothetical protein